MLRFLTAGESHGPALTTIVEGMPAGVPLTEEIVNGHLARRQVGYGRGGRMKIETDTARILSGVRFGQTLGSPIALLIENRDWPNWVERMRQFDMPSEPVPPITTPRPGHADLPGMVKYRTGICAISWNAPARGRRRRASRWGRSRVACSMAWAYASSVMSYPSAR